MEGSIPEGAVVGGRWRIVGFLGAGGFGQVLLAEDVSEVGLGRAAVKVLHPNTTPQERQAFLSEVKKIAVLRHQNLVGYLDSGQLRFDGATLPDHGGEIRPYLVTELCERSLDDHIAASPDGRLSTAETTSVLLDVTAGLAHLHDRDLIHRDIKPGNVLLADGRWKLADFGLMRDLTATGTYHRGELLIGTPVFMAPELFTTMMATAPSDIYAVGVLAHLCAAGRALHAGAGPALVHNIATIPPSIDPSVEGRLAELIRRCTHPQPDRRPTADQLTEWLVTGPPPPAAPVAAPAPATVVAGAQPKAPPTAGGHGPPTAQAGGPWPPPAAPDAFAAAAAPPSAGSRRGLIALVLGLGVLAVAAGGVLALGVGNGDGGAPGDEANPDRDRTATGATTGGATDATTVGDGTGATTGGVDGTGPGVDIGDGVEVGDGVVADDAQPAAAGVPLGGAESHFDRPPCLAGPVNQVSLTNRHSAPVDYQLTIHHFDAAGVRIAESFEIVRALPAGQRALMGMKPAEEGVVTCEIERFTAVPTNPDVLATAGEAQIVSCVLDEFFGNWYDIVYTVGNPTQGPVIAETAFGIVDAEGVRIDESSTNTTFGVGPGERVQQETSAVFWNMDEVEQEPAECIVTWVGLRPDRTG